MGGGKGVDVGGKTEIPPDPQEVRKKKTAIRFNQRSNFILYLSVFGLRELAPVIRQQAG
jgi:hypothetical protein